MDLSEFILQRVAEDEEVARAAGARIFPSTWQETKDRIASGWHLAHIARWDPARVLAECQAKRRIVEHHAPHRGDDEFPLCAICTEVGPEAQGWPCLTLRLLAAVYSDHPDYREEWAVQ